MVISWKNGLSEVLKRTPLMQLNLAAEDASGPAKELVLRK
jgi:hypothetical protein